METLPEKVGSTVATFDGQPDLWQNPRSFLTADDVMFERAVEWVSTFGATTMADIKRSVALVAWAGWLRFEDEQYESFVIDLAAKIEVSVVTLKRWRDALIKSEALPIPAAVDARRIEAAKAAATRKAAAQTGGAITLITGSKVIAAKSEEAEPESPAAEKRVDSGLVGGVPEADFDSPSSPSSEGDVTPSDEGAIPQPTQAVNHPDEVPGSPDPALQRPLNPPELVATEPTDEDRIDAFYALLDTVLPRVLWRGSNVDRRETLTTYINELRAVKAEDRAESTKAPEKRRSGYKVTPADRAKAKLEAVPEIDPANCPHPKEKRKALGYFTLCTDCGRKVA